MTPQPQPEKCSHWRVCKFANDLLYCPADATDYHKKPCLYDSRPHQPAAQCKYWRDASNLKSDFIGQVIGDHYCALDLTDHDNALAATIRNETLDDFALWVKTEWVRQSIEDYKTYKSLRTSTQEQHR